MAVVKINGTEYKIPASWDDINVRQFLKLKKLEEYDDIKFLSIMLDVEKSVIENCDNEDLDLLVYPHLSWYMEKSIIDVVVAAEQKEQIQLGDKTIKVPKDIMLKKFVQKVLMEQIIEKTEDPFDALGDICAIYLYNEYYEGEEVDADKVWKFRDEFILTAPILIMYPIGTFFLKKLKESTSKKISIWLANIPQKRREQALSNLKNLNT